MALTKEQAAAAALIVRLAGAGGGGGAGTSAGGSAGAKGGGGAGPKAAKGPPVPGSGEKKVETQQGAAFYHLPIGSLIIAHEKTVTSTGAPNGQAELNHSALAEAAQDKTEAAQDKAEAIKDAAEAAKDKSKPWIPEPKWLAGQAEWEAIWKANEWKGEGSRHLWVGGHMYSVPSDADVYVPKDFDLTKDHDAAEAEKIVIIGKPGAGRAAKIMANGQFQEITFSDQLLDQLKDYGQKMPSSPNHLPVQVGDAQHWVPPGWHVYKGPVFNYVYARDPQGHWHTISKSGIKDVPETSAMMLDAKVANGEFKPYEHPTQGLAGHQPPPAQAPAGQPVAGKTLISGIEVTYGQVSQAIELLNNDQSTQVKLPLKNAGHPLADMDYHAISAEEMKNYPELKLAKGTKQKHVGQVKNNILHYLARVVAEQPSSDAHEVAAEQAQDSATGFANFSTELAPTEVHLGGTETTTPDGTAKTVGGVDVTAADIQAAIDALNAHPTSTAIKQILKGAGNPLASTDYWQVISNYVKDHPEVNPTGKAREVFIMALQDALGTAQKGDVTGGTDAAQQLENLLAKAHPLVGTMHDLGSNLAKALQLATKSNTDLVVYHPHGSTTDWDWQVWDSAPHSGIQFKVTPSHKVTVYSGLAATEYEADTIVAMVAPYLQGDLDKKAAADAVAAKVIAEQQEASPPAPEKPKTIPVQIHGVKVAEVPEGSAIYVIPSSPGGAKWVLEPDGSWHKVTPTGYSPTFVAPAIIQGWIEQGQIKPLSEIPQAAAPPPEPAGIPVYVNGQLAGHVPEGSKIYASLGNPKGSKWVIFPDGTKMYYNGTSGPSGKPSHVPIEGHVAEGNLVQTDSHGNLLSPPPEPAQESIQDQINNLVKEKEKLAGGIGKPLSVKLAQVLWKMKYGQAGGLYIVPSLPNGGGWHNSSAEKPGWLLHVESDGSVTMKDPGAGNQFMMTDQGVLNILKGNSGYEEGPLGNATAHGEPSPVPADTPAEPAKEEPWIPVIFASGELASEGAPPGSQLFYSPESWDISVYAKDPQGSWWDISGHGTGPAGFYIKEKLAAAEKAGTLKPYTPPTPEQVANLKEAAELLKQVDKGVVDPQQAKSSWQAALVGHLAKQKSHYGNDLYIWQGNDGHYVVTSGTPGVASYFQVNDKTLEASYHSPAAKVSQPVPFSEIKSAINDNLINNAVSISIDGEQKLFKYGNYYKPKGKGAYLEIAAAGGMYGHYHAQWKYGTAAKADYIWHKTDGSKENVSPVYAANALKTATDYHPPGETVEYVPKTGQAAHSAMTASYATVGPGVYQVAGSGNKVEIYNDGTGLSIAPGGASGPASEGSVTQFLLSGSLLDDAGNSVLKPGLTPAVYYLFSTKFTPVELMALKVALEEVYDDKEKIATLLLAKVLTSYEQKKTFADWTQHLASETGQGHGWTLQRDAALGLIKEMLAIPQADPALFVSAAPEPHFLKSLPKGIAGPADIFAFNAQGQAHPHDAPIEQPQYLNSLPSTELADTIKEISAQYGGGKVIGQHVASMSKQQRVAWLKAFLDGDMGKVFAIDAITGKVSPAHPGAPGNEPTHHITWAPFGEGQIPAGQPVPGQEWSDPTQITLPLKEAANYLIKAGLEHAEFLTPSEQRTWVTFHMAGQQEQVDELSRHALARFKSNQEPLTQPLAWTPGLKPAHPYDSYWDEKKPAEEWPVSALKAFYADHYADTLAPYDPGSFGPGIGYAAMRQVVSRYIEDIRAKEIAEKSIPVYTMAHGAKDPGGTHPIFEITETVPLTGKTTAMFFKPAPPGKKFIPDAEHYAAVLGNLWGFKTPSSKLIEFNGEYGAAQVKLNPVGDLEFGQSLSFYDYPAIDWEKITQQMVSDIAREHLLDWALDNNDNRAANMLVMADGTLVGIDKGRAWAAFGSWDGLAGASGKVVPGEGSEYQSAQVSTALYSAIRQGLVSKDMADQAFRDVMVRAQKMAKLPDDRLRFILEQAFANRTSKWGELGSREAVIQAAIDRKNSLASDFHGLWKGLYKAAKLGELPEIPVVKLPTLKGGEQLHAGFTEPEFMDAVAKAGPHGVPAFFGGPDIADAHALVYTEETPGGTVLKGKLEARGEGLDALVHWAQAHQSHKQELPLQPSSVKSASAWYTAIINAAKTISHHQADQEFNASKLTALAQAKSEIQKRLVLAEKVAQDPSLLETSWVPLKLGGVMHNIDAAKHYLSLIKQVEDGKENHVKFQAGQLPDWTPPKDITELEPEKKPEPEQVQLTAQKITPSFSVNSDYHGALQEDGTKHVSGSHAWTEGGDMNWSVDLPTGENVQIWGRASNDVAHEGWITFTAKHADGNASLERVRDFLQSAGLPLPEAEEHHLELFYWRHLASVLAERHDAKEAKNSEMWDTLKNLATQAGVEWNSYDLAASVDSIARANLAPDEELAMWHAAWAKLTSAKQIQEFTDAQGWLPNVRHMSLVNPAEQAGPPFWLRFDATWKDLKPLGNPGTRFSHLNEDSFRAGGVLSRDERERAIGIAVEGQDNPYDSGATGFVFALHHPHGGHSVRAYYSPTVLAHTSTYGWDGDNYGRIKHRKSLAYFRLSRYKDYTSGANEVMIKGMVSLLDEIEVLVASSASERDAELAYLRDHGIYEIRGVPIEERIIGPHQSVPAALAAIRQQMKAEGYIWQ